MGGLEKLLGAPQAALTPLPRLPSAPMNNFQECFSWLCVSDQKEGQILALLQECIFQPCLSFFFWFQMLLPLRPIPNVKITN